MQLESINLLTFRNFTKQKITLDRKLSLFVGDNAQGKTNIVEGIFVLATTKSFRSNTDAELIKWGEQAALVSGKFGSNEIMVEITSEGKKLTINKQVRSRTAVVGMLPVVLFSPESLSIMTGSPDKRRKYLDQVLSMTNKTYLYNLSRYIKAVRNRNRLLINVKQGQSRDLSVWDNQIVRLGSYVWSSRLSFVDDANQGLKTIGQKLMGAKINIDYHPLAPNLKSDKEIGRVFSQELDRRKDEDIARGINSFGAHRDDFKVFFEIVKKDKILEKDVSSFGSRGEQRIATLALKLHEVEFIERNLGERPLLLLDDVLSEFDKKNREHVVALLSRQQSVITSTSAALFPSKIIPGRKIFEVKEGEVRLESIDTD